MIPQSIWAYTPEGWIKYRAKWLQPGDCGSIWFFARSASEHPDIRTAMRRLIEQGMFAPYVQANGQTMDDMWVKK